ncbi:MAG: hypothetical protein KGN36_04370 [Acidobacteriota bacterium]|nr:hypothetical protein [Acidobacteriota bacterium]
MQRWEASGMPVYRQGEGAKARVFAYTDELEAWVQASDGGRPAAPAAARRRIPWWAAAVLVAVLTAGGWMAWRLRGGEPHSWSFEGDRLLVREEAGRVLWEQRFAGADFLGPYNRDPVTIADIDGDGHSEVLVNLLPANVGREGGSLACYEHGGGLRWQFRYGGIRRFGGRTFEPDYRGRFVRPLRAGGKRYVLTVANHFLWYPAQVALLDPRTGKAVEEYWHPGSIYHYALHDTDGDGADEFVFSAINNPGQGLGHAAVGVLELPFSRAKRAEADPRFPPPTGGGEAAYVLFPLPDMCRVEGQLPMVQDLTLDALGRLRVQVPAPEGGGIIYYLDRRLRVLEYRLTDNYAAVHERLRRGGHLDHALGSEEERELGKLVEFAAAPDGNSAEVRKLWRF